MSCPRTRLATSFASPGRWSMSRSTHRCVDGLEPFDRVREDEDFVEVRVRVATPSAFPSRAGFTRTRAGCVVPGTTAGHGRARMLPRSMGKRDLASLVAVARGDAPADAV